MAEIDSSKLILERPGQGFHVRLFFAWAAILLAALLYCLLHSVVAGSYELEAIVTARWLFVHWGGWPILLPACYWLIRSVERRAGIAAGIVAAVPVAIVGAAAFAWLADHGTGGEWTFIEALYHMAPIAAGTYLVFVAAGFWMLHPSILSISAREAVARQPDESVSLPVWKGRLQTRIDVASIRWARAARNYVEFFTAKQSYLMRASITEMESLLPADRFVRVHRSNMVNLSHVQGIEGGRTRPAVVLDSGARVPVGRSYRASVLARIEADRVAG